MLEGLRLKTRSMLRDLLYLSYILLQKVRMVKDFGTVLLWISTIFDLYITSEGTHGAGLCDSITLDFYFLLSYSLETTKF